MPLPFHTVVIGGYLVQVWIQGAREPLLLAMFGVFLFSVGVAIRHFDTRNRTLQDSTRQSDEAPSLVSSVPPMPARTTQPLVSYGVITQFHLPLSKSQDSTNGSAKVV
jgi:hypothetical protein